MIRLVFTPLIQTTIAVLYDIANGGSFNCLKSDGSSMLSLSDIVLKLEAKRIIRLKTGQAKECLSSYELTQSIHVIPLLDILEAVGERIDYDNLIPEVSGHFNMASDTQTIKRIINAYLETIKLADLRENKQ